MVQLDWIQEDLLGLSENTHFIHCYYESINCSHFKAFDLLSLNGSRHRHEKCSKRQFLDIELFQHLTFSFPVVLWPRCCTDQSERRCWWSWHLPLCGPLLLQAPRVTDLRPYSRGRARTGIGGQRIKTAGPYALDLAQVRERHEMHIVCVHLNKDKCQISMAPGSLHVRWSTLLGPWMWGHQ